MGTNPLLFVLPLIVKVLYLQQDIIIDNEKRKKKILHKTTCPVTSLLLSFCFLITKKQVQCFFDLKRGRKQRGTTLLQSLKGRSFLLRTLYHSFINSKGYIKL
jgi:hypothetical protein